MPRHGMIKRKKGHAVVLDITSFSDALPDDIIYILSNGRIDQGLCSALISPDSVNL